MSIPELSVVMPVYNEEAAIEGVVTEWVTELDRLGIDYELRLYDDGSRDRTGPILEQLATATPRVVAQSHANRGHGPTILRGYGEALGVWVFQTDSDGEMPAAGFETLWKQRHAHDLLVGSRAGRKLSFGRFLLTFGSRAIVAMAFGRGVQDVNAPFRLMRGTWLRETVLPHIPASTAVPNIAVCGLAARHRARIVELGVPYTPRRQGRSSINLGRAARLAWRGVVETLRIMRSAR